MSNHISKQQLQRRLAINIRELRDETGMTQHEVAERAGVDRSYLARIETGNANPSLFVLTKIGSAMGMDVHSFLSKISVSVVDL